MSASSSSNFNYGFPTPGPQKPTGQKVMDDVFFVNNTEWKRIREEESFDYIIIGSGICGYAFSERILRENKMAKILIIERGTFFLPVHFQNLPFSYKNTLGGLSETFPWTVSRRTHDGKFIKFNHGMVPFYGGRSIMWSTWCPFPTDEEMNGWPQPVITSAKEYRSCAEELLNVIPANEIDSSYRKIPTKFLPLIRFNQPIYGLLQDSLYSMFPKNLKDIKSSPSSYVIHAPLAVDAPHDQTINFQKFAVPGPLLSLVERQNALATENKGSPLYIIADCTVTHIMQQEGKALALDTTRGVVNIGNAQLILAMGTLPPTTLVLNSFPLLKNIGKRFTAHFISAITARIQRKYYDSHDQLLDLEIAALYIAGIDTETQGQFHIQMTALSDKHPVKNADTALRYMPDVVATATKEQLLTSTDSIVYVCAVLGELDASNKNNWFQRNDGKDPTTNVTLQAVVNENDLKVWDSMENRTFEVLEKTLLPNGACVEYWHDNEQGSGEWMQHRPSTDKIRVPGMVHEASTLWIGEDAPVDFDYKLNHVENVYVTGGALWPRGGSWNPTLTMVGLTQHLADTFLDRQAKK